MRGGEQIVYHTSNQDRHATNTVVIDETLLPRCLQSRRCHLWSAKGGLCHIPSIFFLRRRLLCCLTVCLHLFHAMSHGRLMLLLIDGIQYRHLHIHIFVHPNIGSRVWQIIYFYAMFNIKAKHPAATLLHCCLKAWFSSGAFAAGRQTTSSCNNVCNRVKNICNRM